MKNQDQDQDQDQNLTWSQYPQEAYTVTLPSGRVAGLGAHPAFSTATGAWNIFWLTYSALDSLAYPKGDLMGYLYSCAELPVCVGAALQTVPGLRRNKLAVSYGQLALIYTPIEFIEFIMKDNKRRLGSVLGSRSDFLLTTYYGDSWFKVAKLNSLKYIKKERNKIVHHDFRGLIKK